MSMTTLVEPLDLPPRAEEAARSQTALETRPSTTVVKDSTLTRLPSLDGWRALSIILVLGSHTTHAEGFPPSLTRTFNYMFDGVLGVRFFFVVSGLLITWLMLKEEEKTQKVNLRNFYIRRALRILPVYLAFLVVIGCIQYFTPCDQSVSNWISNLTFTRNFFLDGNRISEHLWSLSVEEQFYLIWPFVFVWLSPAARTRVMPAIVAGALLTSFAARFLPAFHLSASQAWSPMFQPKSFFNHVDALAIGCLAAILLATRQQRLRSLVSSRPAWFFAAGVLLFIEPFIVYWLTTRSWAPPALRSIGWFGWYVLGPTSQIAGFALFVLQSILLPSRGLYRCMNWRPVAMFGALSYSIYIWQQIFFIHPANFGMQPVWWLSYPFWLVPVLAAAVVSYHCLEKPFFNLRHRFR